MTLINRFRSLGYLWPGIDAAADLLETGDRAELRAKVAGYFAELRAAYGREVISLTFHIFGNEAKFGEADAVSQNIDAIQSRASETPNLLSLLATGLRFNRVPADAGVFRTHAVRQGLTPAGWRWLTHQEAASVRRLTKAGLVPSTIAWINLLAKAGEPLPAHLAAEGGIHNMSDISDQVIGTLTRPDLFVRSADMLVDFLRISLRGARNSQRPERRQFVMQYEMLTVELVRRFRTGQTLKGMHGTWENLCERVERAYRDRERQAAEQQREVAERREAVRLAQEADTLEQSTEAEIRTRWLQETWTSAVPRSTIHGIEVIPLCSNDELVIEGKVLDHCLKDGTYLPLCIAGESRIFSLRGEISSVRATLQISNYNGRWLVSQLKTFANATAPAIFRTVAKEVCDQYNAA